METFKLTRIFPDANGDTHFDDQQVPLTDAGPIGYLSAKVLVKQLVFRKVRPEYDFDFHQAPDKQYIILLDGAIEIETSLGEKRQFKGGDVLLLEDTTGKGHRTKNLEAVERRSLFITFD